MTVLSREGGYNLAQGSGKAAQSRGALNGELKETESEPNQQ